MAYRINSSPLVKTYTLEEFWELPDPPDRSKLELIAGVLYMTPPPPPEHDDVATRLVRLFSAYLIATNDKGRLYVPRASIWTSARTYLEPDLFYVSAELRARLDPKRRTSADLVVEIISPGSAIYDRNTKAETYAALGVRELWLVDETAETIEVRCQRSEASNTFDDGVTYTRGEQLQSTVLPNLNLTVDSVFTD